MTTTHSGTPAPGQAAPVASTPAELPKNEVSGLGVFAQGLAAAAPSVALAGVPGALFLVAGKGALWSAIIGGAIVWAVAAVIALQAKRTVSSGSLGTYAGNGLGPGAAFVTGWALILGYIGFAAGGVLGAVLYFNGFLEEIGVDSDHVVFKVIILVIVTAVAFYIPLRGVNISVKFGLWFEVVSLLAISVIIIAAYISYGARFDSDQLSLHHLGASATLVAVVNAVASYAGFESAASLGSEAKHAHRSVPRAILRLVIGLSVLYLLATYPEVLSFSSGKHQLDPDAVPLPTVADNAGVGWATYIVDLSLGTAMVVFSAAVINSGSRSIFTLSREGALPARLGRVSARFGTPATAIIAIGIVSFVVGLIGTLSAVGRFQWDVYVSIVSGYSYLFAYLIVAIATPLWLWKIRALGAGSILASLVAIAGIGYVIFRNLVPVPAGAYAYLPYVFVGLIALGAFVYLRLRIWQPEVARRVGTIQTLSEEEQQRLATLGLAAPRVTTP